MATSTYEREVRDARLLENVQNAIQALYEARLADAYRDILAAPSSLHAITELRLPNQFAYGRAAFAISSCNDDCLDIAHRVRSSMASRMNHLAPVYRLPPEVVINVLSLVGYSDRVHASQAFSHWRQTTVACPSLWNVITVGMGLGHIRRLEELAQRAQKMPLHVTVSHRSTKTVQGIVNTYADRLARFNCSKMQSSPDHDKLSIPRCELLSDLSVCCSGRQLDIDNALLPNLENLLLQDVGNVVEILENIRTPASVGITLPSTRRLFGNIGARLKLSTLHGMVERCHRLLHLSLSGVSNENTTLDVKDHSMRQLKTLFLGTDGFSNVLYLLDRLPAESMTFEDQGRPRLLARPLQGSDPLAAMFVDLQEPVTVTIAPTPRPPDIPTPAYEAEVAIAASDRRGHSRELRGVANLRGTLKDSGLLEKVEHLECSAKIWFDHLVTPSNPKPLPAPQLLRLVLTFDEDFPMSTAPGIRMPVCPMLRTLVVYDQRTPILLADEVDEFLESIVGMESDVYFQSVQFVGPLLASRSGIVTFNRASRVEFKTVSDFIE